MPDKPPYTSFNLDGVRFVACPDTPSGKLAPPMPGYRTYSIWRWDPPEGYNRVATCFGMQGVDAVKQSIELAAWYNTKYPLPVDAPYDHERPPRTIADDLSALHRAIAAQCEDIATLKHELVVLRRAFTAHKHALRAIRHDHAATTPRARLITSPSTSAHTEPHS